MSDVTIQYWRLHGKKRKQTWINFSSSFQRVPKDFLKQWKPFPDWSEVGHVTFYRYLSDPGEFKEEGMVFNQIACLFIHTGNIIFEDITILWQGDRNEKKKNNAYTCSSSFGITIFAIFLPANFITNVSDAFCKCYCLCALFSHSIQHCWLSRDLFMYNQQLNSHHGMIL